MASCNSPNNNVLPGCLGNHHMIPFVVVLNGHHAVSGVATAEFATLGKNASEIIPWPL
jgi:hypothetical protein